MWLLHTWPNTDWSNIRRQKCGCLKELMSDRLGSFRRAKRSSSVCSPWVPAENAARREVIKYIFAGLTRLVMDGGRRNSSATAQGVRSKGENLSRCLLPLWPRSFFPAYISLHILYFLTPTASFIVSFPNFPQVCFLPATLSLPTQSHSHSFLPTVSQSLHVSHYL